MDLCLLRIPYGQPARYEYNRCSVRNIFLACEPLTGKRMVKIKERKNKQDWVVFLEEIAVQYKDAENNSAGNGQPEYA